MKLSYANVAATIALVLAIGTGTVYAAAKIGSSDIKKDAIKSKHVKGDTLTGDDVKEKSLGKVPEARTVGGVSVEPITAAMPVGDEAPPVTVYEGSTGAIEVACEEPGTVAVFGGHGSDDAVISFDLTAARQGPNNPEHLENTLSQPGASNGISSATMVSGAITFQGAGAAFTRVNLTATLDADAFGDGDGCFVSGTIESATAN